MAYLIPELALVQLSEMLSGVALSRLHAAAAPPGTASDAPTETSGAIPGGPLEPLKQTRASPCKPSSEEAQDPMKALLKSPSKGEQLC